jgi:hypothetical protein
VTALCERTWLALWQPGARGGAAPCHRCGGRARALSWWCRSAPGGEDLSRGGAACGPIVEARSPRCGGPESAQLLPEGAAGRVPIRASFHAITAPPHSGSRACPAPWRRSAACPARPAEAPWACPDLVDTGVMLPTYQVVWPAHSPKDSSSPSSSAAFVGCRRPRCTRRAPSGLGAGWRSRWCRRVPASSC